MSTRGRRGFVPVRIGAAATVVGFAALAGLRPVAAQQAQTLNGAPQQVIPYATEPGVPVVTIPPGTINPLGGGMPGGGTGGIGGGSSGDSSALQTMEQQTWGLQAIQNATQLGVNPSALAATCVVESGCQNVGGSGSAQGVFQMQPAAYQEGLAAALAADPSLASQIVQGDAGRLDPTTEAIAAAGYLMKANQALADAGITNPTVLQARGYYNFGPTAGLEIAQASPGDPMSSYLSASVMKANGISPGETVSQWQASVSAKIGGAAGQTILT